MKRIAIIGSGISGLGAAYALKDTANITVYEANGRAGGHAHTMDVDYDGTQIAVDVGFIVYNALNYPNLIGFFEALGVATEASDMSFAVSNPHGYEWASTLNGIFAQRRNFFRPRFHKFWRTILKFNDLARAELEAGKIDDISLGFWLDKHGFDQDFLDNYILPMGGAIWSTPEAEMLDYPARSFFQFFENHRLMHKERPRWRTVSGGSRKYVETVAAQLGERLRLNTPVQSVAPFGEKLRVVLGDGCTELYDDVILATHADTTRALLDDGYESQRFLLGSTRYRPNTIYLHRDPSLMPRRKAAWASWNVIKQDTPEMCLTYWMNRLQNLPDKHPLFVTLNPQTPPANHLTFATMEKAHPQFDGPAEAAVRELKRIQGTDGIWLAGAWMGSGFHEDGLKSGLACALSLGGRVPWQVEGVDLVTKMTRASESDKVALGAIQS
ncbi:MAG: FAD-dependent oxidoreductase [Hyphomonadaceae bacterium]|nr:FAD-dependent oxidoreductase [Hyphomonadaceae bacterium]